jgi:hypothetical protein
VLDNEQIKEAVRKAADLVVEAPADLKETAFKVVLEHLLRGGAEPSASPRASSRPEGPSLGINEFLARVAPSSHVERVTAIAYHAYRSEAASISTKDVAEAYTKARAKKPQNIPDVIGICIQRGYLVETEKKNGLKSWTITPTGEGFIDQLAGRRDV